MIPTKLFRLISPIPLCYQCGRKLSLKETFTDFTMSFKDIFTSKCWKTLCKDCRNESNIRQ